MIWEISDKFTCPRELCYTSYIPMYFDDENQIETELNRTEPHRSHQFAPTLRTNRSRQWKQFMCASKTMGGKIAKKNEKMLVRMKIIC